MVVSWVENGMKNNQTAIKGFTLIEILLVLIIISIIIWAAIVFIQERIRQTRINTTSIQIQQILNAGLSYYVANGNWPPTLSCLEGLAGGGCSSNVIYVSHMVNPWGGGSYSITSTPELLYVYTTITTDGDASIIARLIAGSLPVAYTASTASMPPVPPVASCDTGTTCQVVAAVNMPGQHINSVKSVNFAGLYRHGGCVPVPVCPVDTNGHTMIPQVMIVPVSVSGINDANNNNVYPISSFTGYATGPAANPPACLTTNGTEVACSPSQASDTYWRACMQVVTAKGEVGTTNTGTGTQTWGSKVTLLALTRCAVADEPSGSPFTVYSR